MSFETRLLLVQYCNLPGSVKAHHEPYFSVTGKAVLRIRRERGLSQQELANLCSVERAKISKIENGKSDCKYSKLIEIALALGVPVSVLTASPE